MNSHNIFEQRTQIFYFYFTEAFSAAVSRRPVSDRNLLVIGMVIKTGGAHHEMAYNQ